MKHSPVLGLHRAVVLGLTLDVKFRQHGTNARVYQVSHMPLSISLLSTGMGKGEAQHYCLCCTQAVELPLMVAQTTAIMEIMHSLVGLVRSPIAVTGAVS